MFYKHLNGKCQMVYIFVLWTASLGLGNQNSTYNQESYSYEMPKPIFDGYKVLVDTITFPEIHESNLYRLGITVDETILDNMEKATRKTTSLGGASFTDKQWIGGTCSFSARYEIPNPKKSFLFWKRPKILLKGELNVRIVNAPSAKAAFEYLLYDASKSSMPIETIAAGFNENTIIHGLGTLSYNQYNRVCFIRDNIAVVIISHGEFRDQVVDIARKIDAKLLKQPLLTYDQLQARCPQVTFTHKRHKVVREKGRTPVIKPDDIFCEVSVPAGINYVIDETKIEGTDEILGILDGRKHLDYDDRREDKTQPLKVEMTVISDELLVTRASRALEVSGSDDEEIQKAGVN